MWVYLVCGFHLEFDSGKGTVGSVVSTAQLAEL